MAPTNNLSMSIQSNNVVVNPLDLMLVMRLSDNKLRRLVREDSYLSSLANEELTLRAALS
jgi:hypothetical protein